MSDGVTLAPRPVILSSPGTFSLNEQIIVTMKAVDNFSFALIRYGPVTHGTNLDQRRIPLPILSSSGNQFELQVHDNPNVLTPGHYLLFALDSNGVPSVGEFIKSTGYP
jgi:hypothetical protein